MWRDPLTKAAIPDIASPDMITMPCPHCGQPISPARLLAQRAKGVKKRFSAEELAKRTIRLLQAAKEKNVK